MSYANRNGKFKKQFSRSQRYKQRTQDTNPRYSEASSGPSSEANLEPHIKSQADSLSEPHSEALFADNIGDSGRDNNNFKKNHSTQNSSFRIKPTTKQAAKRKVMDMIARRDHSEKELRKKLKEKFSDKEDGNEAIEEAIEFAKDHNWLGDPAALAHRLADMLHRRYKGIYYINNYLKEKGLPVVEADRSLELEKALTIVKNKYAEDFNFTREEKARVARLLASRGFDSETVRKVLYEKL